MNQTPRVLAQAPLVAFVASTDLTRSRTFYGGILGLTETESSPFACVFDAGGTQLRVTAVGEVATAPYTTLGWVVTNIEDSIHGLVTVGVTFRIFDGMEQDAVGVWTTPDGSKVAWFNDPDGNLLSLTQPA